MIYDLSIHLNTDIDITQNKKGSGKLTISYDNQNELERIFNLIQKNDLKKIFNIFFYSV